MTGNQLVTSKNPLSSFLSKYFVVMSPRQAVQAESDINAMVGTLGRENVMIVDYSRPRERI